MVVTVTPSVAVCELFPVTVKAHEPGATPVTVNGPAPEDGETVAIPLHELLAEFATENEPVPPL